MFNRIFGIILRYWYCTIRSWDRLTDFFYWPLLDLVLWGVTGAYVERASNGQLEIVSSLICGIILWYAVYRTQGDISINVLEEIWNKNLLNIFSSPISLGEYTGAVLLFSLFKSFGSALVAAVIGYLIYGVNILTLGWYLVPFVLLLTLFGWSIGILVSGLLLRFSTKIQSVAWSLVWFFAPFTLVYFPREILPGWAYTLSLGISGSYVMEEMRSVLAGTALNWHNLWTAAWINLIYLVVVVWFFRRSFQAALNRGLIKVY